MRYSVAAKLQSRSKPSNTRQPIPLDIGPEIERGKEGRRQGPDTRVSCFELEMGRGRREEKESLSVNL